MGKSFHSTDNSLHIPYNITDFVLFHTQVRDIFSSIETLLLLKPLYLRNTPELLQSLEIVCCYIVQIMTIHIHIKTEKCILNTQRFKAINMVWNIPSVAIISHFLCLLSYRSKPNTIFCKLKLFAECVKFSPWAWWCFVWRLKNPVHYVIGYLLGSKHLCIFIYIQNKDRSVTCV